MMFVRCSYSPRSNHPSRQLFLSQPQRHHTMKMKMLIISAVLLLLSTSSSSTFFFCSAQQQQTPAACPSSVTTVETCETFCIDSSSSSTNATASSSSFVSFVTEISDWESYQLGGTRCSCTFNFDDGTTMSSSCETAFVLETCDAVNVLSCGAPCNDFCTSLGFVVDECRGGNRNRECECRGLVEVDGNSVSRDFYVCYNDLSDISSADSSFTMTVAVAAAAATAAAVSASTVLAVV